MNNGIKLLGGLPIKGLKKTSSLIKDRLYRMLGSLQVKGSLY